MRKVIIETNDIDNRLDKTICSKCSEISRATVQRLLKENRILVNGELKKSSYIVKLKDEIIINDEIIKEATLKEEKIELDIVYEDNDIIVVNKQKGMVVHPGNGNLNNTLANAVLAKCKGSLSGIGGKIRPGIVHRLDKDTSGIIIIAKNDLAHLNLSNQIKNREVKKTYIALVRGIVKENEATINMPIGRDKKYRTKMSVRKDGKEAITHFKVLYRYNKEDVTLLEVQIETGRTHQIRVHLAEIGYPVIGDEVYSNGKNSFDVKGQMLHAQKLEFEHPISRKKLKLEASLPKYFQKILDELNKQS